MLPKIFARAGMAAATVLLLAGAPARAFTPTALYVFGDSLSDAGNDYTGTLGAEPVSPPYSKGRFTNGRVWIQDLALHYGLPSPSPSLKGGTDFAYGGAETGQNSAHTLSPLDLPAQLAEFLVQVPHPKAGALYTIWAGGNDLFSALAVPGYTQGQVDTVANQAVANIATFMTALAANGAVHVMVVYVPNLGVVPTIALQGTQLAYTATTASVIFNDALVNTLMPLAFIYGLDLRFVDVFDLLDAAIASPAAYGFTDVKDPCWTGDYTSKSSGSVCANTLIGQNKYLFWDTIHPTARGHDLIFGLARSVLNAK